MVKLHHIRQWVREKFEYDDLSEEEYIEASVEESEDIHTIIVTCGLEDFL